MEQEPGSVVVEDAEAVYDSFDLLDQQVGAFGGGVGEPVGALINDSGGRCGGFVASGRSGGCGGRKLRRGWSGGASVFVDEAAASYPQLDDT